MLCFWRRVIGVPFLIFLALAVAFLVTLIQNGDRSWKVGVLGAVLGVAIALVIAVYVNHSRITMQRFRAMRVPEGTLTASEDSFTVASELGSSTLRWNSVTEVWQCPSFWLVLFSKAQFITLPLADITPEARAFILGRIQDSGGKIRWKRPLRFPIVDVPWRWPLTRPSATLSRGGEGLVAVARSGLAGLRRWVVRYLHGRISDGSAGCRCWRDPHQNSGHRRDRAPPV